MKYLIYYHRKIILLLSVLFLGSSLYAQKSMVKGVVSDSSGPLIGVTVMEKGTKTGTLTDIKGNFSINCSNNGSLVISYLGYETQTVAIEGRAKIEIELKEKSQNLNEVVVVGYGTMKKRDITGSISSLNAKEIEQNQPINIASALQGKVSGLEIMSSSEPGTSSSFKIRGTSTLSEGGSDPLFIVDGMETNSIDNINPRDIASVEILKDAASAAIYGSKSANGVIIITTKEGTSQKPKVSISYSMKQSQIAHTLAQMNRLEGAKYETLRKYLAGDYSIQNRDSLNPAFTADNFYQELLFRKAYTQQVDASIAGAEKKLKYYISAGFLDEQGIQLNTYNKRLTSRINVDYMATPKLSIGNRASITLGNIRTANGNTRVQLLSRPANYSVYEPDGSFTPVISGRPNPLAATLLGPSDTKNYNINLNEYLEYKILPELRFKTTISGSFIQSNVNNFSPSILDQALRARSTNSNSSQLNWTHDDVLTYSKNFNKVHDVVLMGGFSLQNYSTDKTILNVTDNISDGITISNYFQGINLATTKATWTGNSMASFFGRASYNYKSRYLLNSNIRYDGSSRFGPNNRWALFPSVSVGWRFSDESFFKWAKPALKDAKLRLSYGVTGNQNTGDFASRDLYTTSTYGTYVGMSPSQLSNPDLRWEQTQQMNAGLDLNFLEGRVNLTLDYYQKQTSDVLYNVKIPQTNFPSNLFQNVGNVDNKGFEITINTTNISTKDFEWSTSLNLSFNKNIISSIPDGGRKFINNVYIVDKGYALSTIYGWKRNAVFAYNESNAFTPEWKQLTPIFDVKDRFTGYQLDGASYNGEIKQMRYSSTGGAIFKGGDVMWDDINKDGVINEDDRQVLGCGQPDFIGGFNTDMRYKNFTFSAFFSFIVGGDVYNKTEESRSNYKLSALNRVNPLTLANSWMAPGDVAFYPSPANAATLDNTREASNLWISDGSYIRLKNIKLNYQLSKKISKSLGVESVNIYGMLQNFLTWTNYKGFDPEIPNGGFSVGYDNVSYPKSKDILFGLNLNF
jgi:TonB-linked SusC/RagA family outer membrane protein